MKNHGLHTMSKCVLRNTPNIPQFIHSINPNPSIIWNIFEKKSPHHMSIVHGMTLSSRYLGVSEAAIGTLVGQLQLWSCMLGIRQIMSIGLSGESKELRP